MTKQKYKKDVNVKLAKQLALQAIQAERDKDYKTATLKWSQAHYVCSLDGEKMCGNRRDLCTKLSNYNDLEMFKKSYSIFDALKF